jgi:hypothetical protein
VLGLSAKLYLRALSISATPDPKVIFIILIIILNLHDPNLSSLVATSNPEPWIWV